MSRKHKIHNYHWKGINTAGKKVSGECLAFSEAEVRSQLNEQQINIRKLKRRSVSFLASLSHKIKSKDITLLTRQMATMLATGIPLLQTLDLIGDSHHKAEMKSLLQKLKKSVEAGAPLSQALSTSSRYFDHFYIDMVTTGEQTGNLSHVFDRLADYREKSERLKAKMVKALIYPAMVVLVSIAVCYLMLTVVIPEFEKMFAGFGADLPWFTCKVLELSHFVSAWGGWILISTLALVFGLKKLSQRSDSVKLLLTRLLMRTPIFGELVIKASIARFSRTLATSFSAGVPILNGLQTSARTAGNIVFFQALLLVYQGTVAGTPFYLSLRQSGVFPKLVEQMVMIGETSGQLDDMLEKVATLYEQDVDDTVDNLGKLLEPLIIVFLGVVVGGLVVAMYLPVFNLMNVLG